jgi:ABC-type uncharacterized transport system substrate-binding protein
VASYSRPGGNITGSSFFFHEINAKRLELMKNLMPTLERAGVLMNPDNPAMTSVLRAIDERAKAKNVRLHTWRFGESRSWTRPFNRPRDRSKP